MTLTGVKTEGDLNKLKETIILLHLEGGEPPITACGAKLEGL